jgi:hypothetical protein
MIAGFATLGGSYLFTALVGMQLLSYESSHPNETCLNCETIGSDLLIPLAGPWIAMTEKDQSKTGPAVLAMLGLAQATGVVLTIAGIIQYKNSAPPSVTVGLAPLPGGGAVGALRGAF